VERPHDGCLVGAGDDRARFHVERRDGQRNAQARVDVARAYATPLLSGQSPIGRPVCERHIVEAVHPANRQRRRVPTTLHAPACVCGEANRHVAPNLELLHGGSIALLQQQGVPIVHVGACVDAQVRMGDRRDVDGLTGGRGRGGSSSSDRREEQGCHSEHLHDELMMQMHGGVARDGGEVLDVEAGTMKRGGRLDTNDKRARARHENTCMQLVCVRVKGVAQRCMCPAQRWLSVCVCRSADLHERDTQRRLCALGKICRMFLQNVPVDFQSLSSQQVTV
jgi:hypothetical protein